MRDQGTRDETTMWTRGVLVPDRSTFIPIKGDYWLNFEGYIGRSSRYGWSPISAFEQRRWFSLPDQLVYQRLAERANHDPGDEDRS